MTDNQKPSEKADSGNSQQEMSQRGNLPKDSPAPVTGFPQKGQVPTIRDSQQQPVNNLDREQNNLEHFQKENVQERCERDLSKASSTASSQMQGKQTPIHNSEPSSTVATKYDHLQKETQKLEVQLRSSQEEVKQLKQNERAYQEIIRQNECSNNYQAKDWWNNFFCRQQQHLTVTESDLLFVRKYPYSVILLLNQLQKTLNTERKSWRDFWTGNDKVRKNLEQEIKDLTTKLQREQERIRALERVEADYFSIKQKNGDLELRCGRLIKEITALKTGGEDAPQAGEGLHSTFKELKNQMFKELSNKVYKLRTQYNPDAKVERKQETAKIRSKLAKIVLMGSVNICKEGNITEEETAKLIKLVTGGFLMYFSSCGCSDITTKFASESQEIEQNLKSITEKSLKLVNNITHASPQGELLWYREGNEFNPEEHEVLVGCVEGGQIAFTVFPGYAVYEGSAKKRRIFEKAQVFTTLDKN
ncbi:MAG: hypothetical protein RJA13_1223 [Bacteroidota bacterium]|jgi:hypothetical protein